MDIFLSECESISYPDSQAPTHTLLHGKLQTCVTYLKRNTDKKKILAKYRQINAQHSRPACYIKEYRHIFRDAQNHLQQLESIIIGKKIGGIKEFYTYQVGGF
jgi:hypothetical protein